MSGEGSVEMGVPLTVEGWTILHQMFRVRWPAWKALDDGERKLALDEATGFLAELEAAARGPSAVFAMLGHKADLMLVHFRRSFEELGDTQLRFAQCRLADFLEPTTSYVSIVELGLYQATARIQAALREQGIEPGSSAWQEAVERGVEEEREALMARLYPPIPKRRYLCFYPMDKKRGETRNWYQTSMEDRQRMMRDHGMIGRRYAGKVMQIISGSIGYDDWEWGVDLFSDDALTFKKLIYEMRFDEASAVYALFGPFYLGVRFEAAELASFMSGRSPVSLPGA